ncbi:ACT domain-containing protein [Kiritimatiellaeota bacterium B1221]|nr:ACT domain-containing protein [Kiritimatiellaeota bacterium B1221]
MNDSMVLTVLGPDRPGIVEALAEQVRNHQGSWQESRLAHLQDQFAGIVEVSLPSGQRQGFEDAIRVLESSMNLQCQFSVVQSPKAAGKSVRLECIGQDRPGIVFAITDVLHDLNVNVESMDTSFRSAPMSGETLFCADFLVQLPALLDLDLLEERLSSIGQELMLDVQLED